MNSSVGFFTLDPLAALFLTVLGLLMIPAYYHSVVYLRKNQTPTRSRRIYMIALTFLCVAMAGVYLSNQIGMTWIFIELTTVASCLLIYHHRDAEALEATWKYIFVCSVSVALSFVGVLFMGIALRSAGLNDFTYSEMLAHASELDPFWVKAGFLFLFAGYTVKAGLFPMFTAGVDAKDQAPTPAAALLATCLCNCGFTAILRVFQIVAHSDICDWAQQVMLISALLSIAIAAYYMVRTKGYKRLLAYSGIEHFGLATLGMAMGGQGYYAALLHVVLHSFVKAALFFQFGQVSYMYRSVNRAAIGDYFKLNVWGGLVLMAGFFSITAMPPSGLFVSESMLFVAMLHNGNLLMTIVTMALLTVILWSLGRSIFSLLFSPQRTEAAHPQRPPFRESLSQFILLGIAVWWGINPPDALIDCLMSIFLDLV